MGKLKQALPVLSPPGKSDGRTAADLREVLNAIFYVVKTGCIWRSLTPDFLCWQTVYGYFNRLSKNSTWEAVNSLFVKKI